MSDNEYFERRVGDEELLAQRSTHPAQRAAHGALAAAYRHRLRELAFGEPPPNAANRADPRPG